MHAFMEMFEHNIVLTKITWRLECRASTKLNQLQSRNKEIERRQRTGKDFADLDPRVRAQQPETSAEVDPQ